MKVALWYIRESDSGEARLYSRLPSSRHPSKDDEVWLPRSQLERCSKEPMAPGERWAKHVVEIPDWLAAKKGL